MQQEQLNFTKTKNITEFRKLRHNETPNTAKATRTTRTRTRTKNGNSENEHWNGMDIPCPRQAQVGTTTPILRKQDQYKQYLIIKTAIKYNNITTTTT